MFNNLAYKIPTTVLTGGGGGTIGGTILAGQVAFGSALDTIAGDNGLWWDNVNKRLGIGTIVPASELDNAGNTTLLGMLAVGDSAAYGSVDGVMRYSDTAWTVTDFTAVNSWRVDSARFIVDPNADYAGDTATARFSQITIPSTNVNDFGTLFANNAIADFSGVGVVTQNISGQSAARLAGAGAITTNVGHNVNVTGTSAAAGTVTNNYGVVVTSGIANAIGTVTNDYQVVLRAPDITGTVTNSRAIYAEDHSVVAGGYFLYSEGGRSYHEGDIGLGVAVPLSKLHINGSLTVKRTASALDYNVLTTDYYIGITDTAAPRTVNLPAAATAGEGKVYIIKDESGAASVNNITIDPDGAETIDGAATFAISTNYGSVTIICSGTQWFIN